MSTRGLYGFRKDGIDKCTYNHSDSYPEQLGRRILTFCKNNTTESLSDFFERIVLVNGDSIPTKDQIQYLSDAYFEDGEDWYNALMSAQKEDEDCYWYDVLRNVQGNFVAYQKLLDSEDTVYMTNDISFIRNSLYCQYAYIVNLDEGVLECYVGFQKKKQKENRYGTRKRNCYYPCRLVMQISLSVISSAEIDTLLEQMIGTLNTSA
mgnify:FL=1